MELLVAFVLFLLLITAIFMDMTSSSQVLDNELPAVITVSEVKSRDIRTEVEELKSEIKYLKRDIDRLYRSQGPEIKKEDMAPEETIKTIVDLLSTLTPPPPLA